MNESSSLNVRVNVVEGREICPIQIYAGWVRPGGIHVSEAGFMLSKAAEITKALGLGKGQASVRY